ncbi:MAG: hypothetical protein JST38_19530 [Bacteroidetes bacterium]|nr:hypothetical protein [Bacteroidota bacterium]MBS1943060.1 hypothetical protein [Bacteroidota bacterium]
MKVVLKACLAVAVLFAACKSDPTQSEQYKQLEQDKDAVAVQSSEKDSTINEMFGAFNRVSENLRMIREKQGLLATTGKGVENGKNMEQGIVDDLRAIDSLLTVNRKIIARMKKSSAADNAKLSELQKAIKEMEQSLNDKDAEIGSLKEQLASTNASLASMIQMYQDKEQQANMQLGELHTAFYCVGSKKELIANNILTKEGGVIGIGSVSKLKTTDLNKSYFKQIDISKMTVIPVNAKKAKVITTHPAGSYELVGKDHVDNLTIKDTTAFWSVSKYLVIEAD